jgi:hypothetical protein
VPNLTLVLMRAQIQAIIPDVAISNARVTSVIQTAHEVFPMEYLVDHVDESSITLATDTWEYALPETSNVSTFVRINGLWLESATAGLFDSFIPAHMWRPTYDGSGVWQIVFVRDWNPVSGRKIRIEGQKRYSIPSGDSDVVTLHNGWVIQYSAGLLHASQGGSDSSMASWHQRMAAFHMAEADKIVDNINNRAKPGSVAVPGVI